MQSYSSHFQRSLGSFKGGLHFAAHSHHPWPDASRDAQLEAWDDAARLLDTKWDLIFGELLPRLQTRVARRIGLSNPSNLVFAPSSHELLVRLVSGIDRPVVRILTTDAEFHSARRQFARWVESGSAKVESVPAEPFDSFPKRFRAAIAKGGYDLVTWSHVFFDSGYVVPDLEDLVAAIPDPRAEVLIDGYHAFNALPVDLAGIESRAFYSAGGYKYAMAGEGCCFLHCPAGRVLRPTFTGWFAGFGSLATEDFSGEVGYGPDAGRFRGSTFDPVALYRLDASLAWMDREGLDPARIHAHVLGLQDQFLGTLSLEGAPFSLENLIPRAIDGPRGHFLTFRLAAATDLQRKLKDAGVLTDARRDRLRIGMGVYHDPTDVGALIAKLGELELLGDSN